MTEVASCAEGLSQLPSRAVINHGTTVSQKPPSNATDTSVGYPASPNKTIPSLPLDQNAGPSAREATPSSHGSSARDVTPLMDSLMSTLLPRMSSWRKSNSDKTLCPGSQWAFVQQAVRDGRVGSLPEGDTYSLVRNMLDMPYFYCLFGLS